MLASNYLLVSHFAVDWLIDWLIDLIKARNKRTCKPVDVEETKKRHVSHVTHRGTVVPASATSTLSCLATPEMSSAHLLIDGIDHKSGAQLKSSLFPPVDRCARVISTHSQYTMYIPRIPPWVPIVPRYRRRNNIFMSPSVLKSCNIIVAYILCESKEPSDLRTSLLKHSATPGSYHVTWENTTKNNYHRCGQSFCPRGASDARVLAVVVCLCVCLSNIT